MRHRRLKGFLERHFAFFLFAIYLIIGKNPLKTTPNRPYTTAVEYFGLRGLTSVAVFGGYTMEEEKISIWRRVGDWLRRSQHPIPTDEVEYPNAENLPIGPEIESVLPEENSSFFSRAYKKEQQLAALEQGFSRLVQVLESINNNMDLQQKKTMENSQALNRLHDMLHSLPESSREHLNISHSIHDELRRQTLINQQLKESMDRQQSQWLKLFSKQNRRMLWLNILLLLLILGMFASIIYASGKSNFV